VLLALVVDAAVIRESLSLVRELLLEVGALEVSVDNA
jgi:hypothetical protein